MDLQVCYNSCFFTKNPLQTLSGKNWPRYTGRVPRACPPCVRLVSALIPLWPRLHTLSALCPPCVRLVSALSALWLRLQTLSAMCQPCVRLVPLESALAPPPKPCAPYVRHVTALCPPRVHRVSALAAPPCARSLPAQVHHVDFVRSWPGPWHHEVKFFPSVAQPTASILHARWSVSLLGIHFGSANSAFASAPDA